MSVTLKASFQITEDKGLAIQARIENTGAEDILVLDRLWRLDQNNRRALDPELVYRFERDGSLRLLFGAAPLPRLKSVTYRNVPMATRLPAGKALEREISLAGPLREYSVYFPDIDLQAHETRTATMIHLVIEYMVARPDLVIHPSPLDPTALSIDNPVFALAGATRLIYSEAVDGFEVLYRPDEFDRLTLPNEAPEPLQLA